MRVSIIIPNWNGREILRACVESCLSQDYGSFEVIVIDNGSLDGSTDLDILVSSRVRVIQLDQNVGFGRAVNIGMRHSQAEYVFLLNNDTTVAPDALVQLVLVADAKRQYDFFAPSILDWNAPDTLYAASVMFSRRGYGNRSQRHTISANPLEREVFGFCGAAVLIRKAAIDDVGDFNEHFFLMAEDVELSYRLQLRGHQGLFVPHSRVSHRGSATLRKIFPVVVEQSIRNAIIVLFTCVPASHLRRIWAGSVKFYVHLSFAIVKRGWWREWLGAIAWILLHIPWMIRRRMALQSGSHLDEQRLWSLLYDGVIEINFDDGVLRL